MNSKINCQSMQDDHLNEEKQTSQLNALSLLQQSIDNQQKPIQTNFSQALWQLKNVSYPTIAIKPVIKIYDLLQTKYFEKVKKQAIQQLITKQNLNYYRQIRGDGNCFVRSVAFQYLASLESIDCFDCFHQLQNIKLTCSPKQNIPKQFLPYYDDKLLCYVLATNWEKQYSKQLQNTDSSNFIIILYFQAMCLMGLNILKQEEELKCFLTSNQDKKIANYGSQSQSMMAYLLCNILKLQINIFQVKKQFFKKYSYRPKKGINLIPVNLLNWNDHYDVLQDSANIRQEINQPILNDKLAYYQIHQNSQLVQIKCKGCNQIQLMPFYNKYCEKCNLQYRASHRRAQNHQLRQENRFYFSHNKKGKKQNKIKLQPPRNIKPNRLDKKTKVIRNECVLCNKIQYINDFGLCWKCSDQQKKILKDKQKRQKSWFPCCCFNSSHKRIQYRKI